MQYVHDSNILLEKKIQNGNICLFRGKYYSIVSKWSFSVLDEDNIMIIVSRNIDWIPQKSLQIQ